MVGERHCSRVEVDVADLEDLHEVEVGHRMRPMILVDRVEEDHGNAEEVDHHHKLKEDLYWESFPHNHRDLAAERLCPDCLQEVEVRCLQEAIADWLEEVDNGQVEDHRTCEDDGVVDSNPGIRSQVVVDHSHLVLPRTTCEEEVGQLFVVED